MKRRVSAGLHVHGKLAEVLAWPANGGSLRLEFKAEDHSNIDVVLFVGHELALDIYDALAPVLDRHGITRSLSERDAG